MIGAVNAHTQGVHTEEPPPLEFRNKAYLHNIAFECNIYLFGTVPLKTVRTLQLELGASTLQLGKKSFGGTHTKTNRESCTPILGFSSSSRLGETTNRGGKKSIFRIRYER